MFILISRAMVAIIFPFKKTWSDVVSKCIKSYLVLPKIDKYNKHTAI